MPALLLCGTCPPGLAAQNRVLDELLARAAAYVEQYERDLGSVIAEEEYIQDGRWAGGRARVVLRSNYLLLRLGSARDHWMAFRDVYRRDDVMVREAGARFEQRAAAAGNPVEAWPGGDSARHLA